MTLTRQQLRRIGLMELTKGMRDHIVGPRKERRKLLRRMNKKAWSERDAAMIERAKKVSEYRATGSVKT